MEKISSCPLDGSWLRSRCKAYEDQKENGSLAACQHRSDCKSVRTLVESDVNESVATVKKVLMGNIPDIFTK